MDCLGYRKKDWFGCKRHSISVRAFHGESLAGLSSCVLQRAQQAALPNPVRRIGSEQSAKWRKAEGKGGIEPRTPGPDPQTRRVWQKERVSPGLSAAERDLAMWWAWFPCWRVCLHSWRPARLCFYWEARRVWALSPPRHATMARGT